MGGGKGGGGGGGMEPDKKYNKRMAKIAENNQDMAKEMFNVFKYGTTYNPNKRAHDGSMIENPEWRRWRNKKGKKRRRIPEPPRQIKDPEGWTTVGDLRGFDAEGTVSEMELMQQMLNSQSRLIEPEEAMKRAGYEEGEKLIRERSGVMQSLYKQALQGVDVEGRVSESRAGVEHAFKNQQGITNRNLGRMGIDPSSGRGLSMSADVQLEKSKLLAGTEAQIRRSAEDENFDRLGNAAGLPI
jgi:hypothetical protein